MGGGVCVVSGGTAGGGGVGTVPTLHRCNDEESTTDRPRCVVVTIVVTRVQTVSAGAWA